MIGKIIAIGDELTCGRIVNSTSTLAARELFLAGHQVTAMHTVGDSAKLIGEVLKQAIQEADFVIVTGGLGPTTDDLTNEAVSAALHRPATLNQELLARIRAQPWGEACQQQSLEKLAWLPEGAEVLNTEARMSGHVLVHDAVPVFFLPGVPGQAAKLLTETVLPRLSARSGSSRAVRMRLYRTVGLSECEINRRLAGLEQEGRAAIGYYPVSGEVHVSLSVAGPEADTVFREADQRIRAALADWMYGTDQETLAEAVGRLLRERRLMLAAAESCTGGLISATITAVPGSSQWFAGGVIAYSNHLKELLLNVDAKLLRRHGAVSGPVAEAMAAGLAGQSGADITVAVTGIAGPSGGSEEKPVGTVYIGLFCRNKVSSVLHHFYGGRNEIQEMTAAAALNAVRRELIKKQTTPP
jgi:nicotinamide-nucleotide amidase